MHKRKKSLLRKGNVVVFPGTIERLRRDGQELMEKDRHEEAVAVFDQLLEMNPDDFTVYEPLAISLYESKDFIRAREFAVLAIQQGTGNYIEILELYLSISIQLQEYEEVELTIQGLLEEGLIPEHGMQKFTYLRELNKRLSRRYEKEQDESTPLITFTDFIEMKKENQLEFLLSLSNKALTSHVPLLKEIIQSKEQLLQQKTYALILLEKQGYQGTVCVKKFHFEKEVDVQRLPEPDGDPFIVEIQLLTEKAFEKDPTAEGLVSALIDKYAIFMFPFHWDTPGNEEQRYSKEEIAEAYIAYTKYLLYGKPLPDTPLLQLVRMVDEEMDS